MPITIDYKKRLYPILKDIGIDISIDAIFDLSLLALLDFFIKNKEPLQVKWNTQPDKRIVRAKVIVISFTKSPSCFY